jgi:hypothetical protein
MECHCKKGRSITIVELQRYGGCGRVKSEEACIEGKKFGLEIELKAY